MTWLPTIVGGGLVGENSARGEWYWLLHNALSWEGSPLLKSLLVVDDQSGGGGGG